MALVLCWGPFAVCFLPTPRFKFEMKVIRDGVSKAWFQLKFELAISSALADVLIFWILSWEFLDEKAAVFGTRRSPSTAT